MQLASITPGKRDAAAPPWTDRACRDAPYRKLRISLREAACTPPSREKQ